MSIQLLFVCLCVSLYNIPSQAAQPKVDNNKPIPISSLQQFQNAMREMNAGKSPHVSFNSTHRSSTTERSDQTPKDRSNR